VARYTVVVASFAIAALSVAFGASRAAPAPPPIKLMTVYGTLRSAGFKELGLYTNFGRSVSSGT